MCDVCIPDSLALHTHTHRIPVRRGHRRRRHQRTGRLRVHRAARLFARLAARADCPGAGRASGRRAFCGRQRAVHVRAGRHCVWRRGGGRRTAEPGGRKLCGDVPLFERRDGGVRLAVAGGTGVAGGSSVVVVGGGSGGATDGDGAAVLIDAEEMGGAAGAEDDAAAEDASDDDNNENRCAFVRRFFVCAHICG